MLVTRFGIHVGPRNGKDKNKWTVLHLAALISTPPLVSFLLNRGADPRALTARGLTPLDLISGIPDRMEVAVFLEHSVKTVSLEAEARGGSGRQEGQENQGSTSLSARRQAMLSRRRAREAERLSRMDEEDRCWHVRLERERWIRDVASVVEVSPELLLPEPRKRATNDRSRLGDRDGDESDDVDSGFGDVDSLVNALDSEVEAEAEGEEKGMTEDEGVDGDIHGASNETMLVFSLNNLQSILDILITCYRPVCTPLDKRSLPANTLYLHARFAAYRCDDSWVEELVEGAVERIEQGVYGNSEDLAFLAFWAYNVTVLLHLFKSDTGLGRLCDELMLLRTLEELVNTIHGKSRWTAIWKYTLTSVFIIRLTERRIDDIFEAALLDHEPLEDFNDVRFEGEWSLFRSFGSRKKPLTHKASQLFSSASSNASPSSSRTDDYNSSPGLFSSLRDNVSASSTLKKTLAGRSSVSNLRSATPRSVSIDSLATVSGKDHPTADLNMGPKQVTDILSSVLVILQLYEVNPALTIQVFSQVFFWISCEVFNKVLSRKKYICRSKAVQIQMNVSALEDWVRANGLPLQTATKHFEPANQLLRWLQCLSQVREFDTLIGTMQSLKAINPLQMRRAVREYRYEINEGRMTEECAQYLAQLQKDWERRRLQIGAHAVEARRRGSMGEPTEEDMATPIDSLFDGSTALTDFIPQSAPESLGELLDSIYMLPFQLPSDSEYLVATPPTDAAFARAPISPISPADPSGKPSRPASISSVSSSRPMGWSVPRRTQLRALPRDFFQWYKDAVTERKYHREAFVVSPARPMINVSPSRDNDSASEDYGTPIAINTSYTPPAHIPSSSPTTPMDKLREQARATFESVDRPSHTRQESYELRQRPASASPSPSLLVTSARSQAPTSPSPLRSNPSTPLRITPQSAPTAVSPSVVGSTMLSPASITSPSSRSWYGVSSPTSLRRVSGSGVSG